MQSKKRGLGKGLAALLPVSPPPATPAEEEQLAAQQANSSVDRVRHIELDGITPNPYQPRNIFTEASLEELAASIREQGVIQPLIVTPRGDQLMIVAGERRWRASRLAGLKDVPVIVRTLDDRSVLEHALVENLQRDNLNPMEEARAFKALMDTFGLSQENVADRVGKSRSAVANALRLLKLPLPFQKDIEGGRITAGHARAILSLETDFDKQQLRDAVVRGELSVREAEQMAVSIANRPKKSKTIKALDPHVQQLRERLIEHLTCRVSVKAFDPTKGRIEIYYDSLDELERVLTAMGIEME
ncbi:chromosome partitioning protein ParB [candidate division BRC1 bacterium HGW-BRC1-1]|jgi:ParB family chromosome partitioning protein|nr:MAG: chromosome partitioning protein ParB [candidate division BRC1 bacterium HGW-BRC1-1]